MPLIYAYARSNEKTKQNKRAPGLFGTGNLDEEIVALLCSFAQSDRIVHILLLVLAQRVADVLAQLDSAVTQDESSDKAFALYNSAWIV